MTWWQTIFLAVVQGLTEFLPISSSGHLVLFQKFFNLEAPVLFDILVHVGTLFSIVIFFRKELLKILKGLFGKEKDDWRIFELLMVGTVPAVIVGLFLQKNINQIFNSLTLLAVFFLVTGLLLLSTLWLKSKNQKNFKKISWLDALIVGLFQAVAIFPAISRSGATLVGGLMRKIDRQTAFQLSFFLAIPAILGALILQIPDLLNNSSNLTAQSLLGMFLAGLVGYFSLKFLKKFLLNSRLWLFSFYCFFLSILIFIFR
jgi:undecaprenyl-diphosphatase